MVGASVVLHVALASWILHLPGARTAFPDEAPLVFASLPPATDEAPEPGEVRRSSAPVVPGGARSAQNVDAPDRGQGGDATGALSFMLLVSGAHGANLQDSPWNAPDVSQVQRIRTARSRASYEDRRATPNPHDQPFLASGEGVHPERRPVAARDASDGARVSPSAAEVGGVRDRALEGDLDPASPSQRAERAGAAEAAPGRGIVGGRGARDSEAARVAFGRPSVDEGPAATLAQTADRPRDDTDAELLAAQLVQSVVDASRRRGAEEGPGRGGIGGGGSAGSGGGAQEGGRASAHGPGRGRHAALDTSDARYRRWYLEQRRRVEGLLEFPRERALARDQGTTVFRLHVRRDGTLARQPRRLRSTGYADFDAEARRAILAAAPFAPLPDDLVPGQPTLRLDMTVFFSNPMVH